MGKKTLLNLGKKKENSMETPIEKNFEKNKTYKNTVLLIASLCFYAWGEPKFVFVMIASIAVNYIFGILINKYPKHSKLNLFISVAFNVFILFVCKYLYFTIQNLNYLFGTNFNIYKIALPISQVLNFV